MWGCRNIYSGVLRRTVWFTHSKPHCLQLIVQPNQEKKKKIQPAWLISNWEKLLSMATFSYCITFTPLEILSKHVTTFSFSLSIFFSLLWTDVVYSNCFTSALQFTHKPWSESNFPVWTHPKNICKSQETSFTGNSVIQHVLIVTLKFLGTWSSGHTKDGIYTAGIWAYSIHW